MSKPIKITTDHKVKMSKSNQSKPTQQDYLDTLKAIRGSKDLDQIQELFLSVISMYGLKTDEVAALLFSTMKAVLNEVANKEFLADRFKIDITKLGPNELDGIQMIQKALLIAYSEQKQSNDET
ncbi:hypothetical protein [Carnobacterium maltaromaticum]|uniref:hypothetical protein n=1 Tax=Carnobacterium maltaromaticum TaxID=2751 RepID=UPI0012FC641E|nr:hypothetical protein [Carnobacterium maltaromaticum]